MHTISVSELQHNLGLYLEKVKEGDEIIVEDENRAIARILPVDAKGEETLLAAKGLIRMPEKQLNADFWKEDAPEISLEKIVEVIRKERDED